MNEYNEKGVLVKLVCGEARQTVGVWGVRTGGFDQTHLMAKDYGEAYR